MEYGVSNQSGTIRVYSKQIRPSLKIRNCQVCSPRCVACLVSLILYPFFVIFTSISIRIAGQNKQAMPREDKATKTPVCIRDFLECKFFFSMKKGHSWKWMIRDVIVHGIEGMQVECLNHLLK